MTEILNACPRCGKPLEVRKGTYGTYLDCTDYPKCKYTAEFSSKNVPEIKQNGLTTPSSCPKCGQKLELFVRKYGMVLGCKGYPKCNYIHNFEDRYNISCPKCGKIMKKRTGPYGRFYGCGGYPKCKFTFDLRLTGKPKEKNQSKKLIFPDRNSVNVTGDDILSVLTRKGKHKEKKQSKKLVLLDRSGFNVTGEDILGALTREGQNFSELINKLELIYNADIKYLKLKLKELEHKGLLVKNVNENEPIWKKI